LLLEHGVALDREDTPGRPEIKEIDERGVDVELVTVFAQATRDPEAETLGPVGQPERRVEAGDDQAAGAARATLAGARHGTGPLA
jgi:hypothetical protein